MDGTRSTRRLIVVSMAMVLVMSACGDSGSDADTATTTEETTTTEAAVISDEDLAATDFSELMMTSDEIAGYFDIAGSSPLDEEESFDLNGEPAHLPCSYPPEDVAVVAGTGQGYRNEGSLGVTQYLGAYSADVIDDSWAALRDAADLEGKCVDFEMDGEQNTVDGTVLIRKIFQAQHGLDVAEDENLLITEFETPSGTKVLDVVVRSGQMVGQVRVVHTSAVSDAEAVAAGAAFVEQFRQALEG